MFDYNKSSTLDYKDMTMEDLKLFLLSGDGIKFGNFTIPQYNMREIKNFGYSNYMHSLQWLTLTVDDFIDARADLEEKIHLKVERNNLKAFDFYTKLGKEDFLQILLVSLSIIFKTGDVFYLEDLRIVAIGFNELGLLRKNKLGKIYADKKELEENKDIIKIVNRDNFDEIINIVKIINYLKPPMNEKEYNPADEATKRLIEQMEENRKRVEDIKKRENDEDDEDSNITVSTIVSAVTVKSPTINKFNVWDLSLYQLYDEYARLEVIDNYDFSIKAMIAGAEDIKYKHWASRI